MKILVVDDQKELLKTVLLSLQAMGFAAVGAGDGRAALERIRNEIFDVVLCDVEMPEMDGVDLFRTLQAEEAHSSLPFVFMSGGRTEASLLSELGVEKVVFLKKPFGFQPLSAALQAVKNEV